MKQIFRMREEKRKKRVVALESWIKMEIKVVKATEKDKTHGRQLGLDEWLNRTMIYQELCKKFSKVGKQNNTNT